MRQLAPFGAACTVLSKIGTLPDMLLVTVPAFLAVAEDRKVATHSFFLAQIDMRKQTPNPRTPPFVQEVQTDRRPLGRCFMREVASLGGIGTIPLEVVPAHSDLGRIVLVHACQSTSAGSCCSEPRTRFIEILALLHFIAFTPRLAGIV